MENCHGLQVSLLYIGLNGFRFINDMHSHQVGDGTLKAVGGILESFCPADLICCIGGDEFLISG